MQYYDLFIDFKLNIAYYSGRQPHPHKVVIAGNHDLTFDDRFMEGDATALADFGVDQKEVKEFLKSQNVEKTQDLLIDCIYLLDTAITICGVKIYGAPW